MYQTCNKSSNSQVQVQVPYPQVQVQVHLKRASPSPSPSPVGKKTNLQAVLAHSNIISLAVIE